MSDLLSFVRADPSRLGAVSFGTWTGPGSRRTTQACWVPETEEMFTVSHAAPALLQLRELLLDAAHAVGPVEIVGHVPRSGHPNPEKDALLVDSILFGLIEWGFSPSLDVLRDSVADASAAGLKALDWTVWCRRRCPLARQPLTPRDEGGLHKCRLCDKRLHVVSRGMTAAALERLLLDGHWRQVIGAPSGR